MNKLEGFYELRNSGLPTVPWKRFEAETKLESDRLWTVRYAVMQGDDMNLPRRVGVTAEEAETFAGELFEELKPNDLVIYYPYFVAQKSGVLEVKQGGVVIEAVKGDLWNLVSENKLDVSIRITEEDYIVKGEEHFLNQDELLDFIDYAKLIQSRYRGVLSEGKSVFLEWSFAFASGLDKQPAGERHLVFYELRTVE